MCGAGVAWSDRGDTEAVVGSGVAQRGWVDRLMFADDSLRPEPLLGGTCIATDNACKLVINLIFNTIIYRIYIQYGYL